MTRYTACALGAVLILMASCDSPVDHGMDRNEPLAPSPPSFIYGGSTDYRDYHGAVVALHQLASGGSSVYVEPFCTGTLIRPDVVLTAAHCLDTNSGAGPDFRTMSPAELAIYVGNNPTAQTDGTYDIVFHLYDVVETLIYPEYDRRNIANDIALVRLASPVTEPYARVIPELSHAQRLEDTDIGVLVNFAGFGESNSSHAYGTKLHVDLPLTGLTETLAQYDMSDEGGHPAGPCFGDNGGPMFLERNGHMYVAGVTSHGDRNCAVWGASTRTDAFESFLVGFGGPAPQPPGGPEPEPIILTAEAYRDRGLNHVALSWTGTAAAVTIYRDDEPIAVGVTGGAHTDELGTRGPFSARYTVCDPIGCAQSVAVQLGGAPPNGPGGR